MSEYYFGVGKGEISRSEIARRRRIAKKHDASFLVMTGNSGHCECGRGCPLDRCKVKHWWFATRNYGSPFNESTARAVEADLAK